MVASNLDVYDDNSIELKKKYQITQQNYGIFSVFML